MTTQSPTRPPAPARERAVSRRRRWVWLAAALALVAVAAVVSVAFGTRVVSLGDVVGALVGKDEGIAAAAVRARVPRTVLALLVGAALGLAGAVMQGVTRNPLGDPGILGITMGASLAVVSGIAFLGITTLPQYVWFALVGAALTSVFVYLVGSIGRGGPTPLKLALAGAATTAAFSSLVSAILLPRIDVMNVFRFWQIGGVGGATWEAIGIVLPFLVVGTALTLASARGLDALALGDDLATGLGVHVTRARVLAAVGAVLLAGAATAVAGPIAFVGLVVPHAARLVVGVDHRWVLPFSALTGAVLLTLADVIGRVVARPGEIEVGIVTALIGAPVFVALARRRRVVQL
ncbi:FecCD family ABC transporter permease [Cellulomonas massiliensis]|uniref:FecCD family ABC transporter permease n=1 Tax=Cellulomonas massiliensis TaxID=1465811 RepID=UPI0006888BD7|nr:iron ABC transporter permease [Cellulomonas massiliensis]